MFAFGAQKETVETTKLTHGVKTVEPPGKHFVHVTLVTDIHHEAVTRRVENTVERNCQLHDTQVWPQMSSRLGKDLDQLIAHFLRELRQILFAQCLDVRWRADPVEQTLWGDCRLGRLRSFRRV